MKPDGQNSVIQKWMLPESLVFRPLVKGNEDSGNEIGVVHESETSRNGMRNANLTLLNGSLGSTIRF